MRSPTIAISLFILAVVTAQMPQPDDVVPEMNLAESTNLALENLMQDEMQASTLFKLSPVTEAIVALKAYCIKAKEVFNDQIDLDTASEGASSLVELVQILGVPMPKDGDVVTEFADAILALRAKAGGLFDYLVKNVNLSVMRGKSPVAPVQSGVGYIMTFSPAVVGLKSMPEYFKSTLGVKGIGYQTLKVQIESTVSDEYDPVSESWKLGKVNYAHAYDKALLRLKNKWMLDKQLVDQMAEAKAQVAIHKEYVSGVDAGMDNMTVLHPLPTAGSDEADDYRSNHKVTTTVEEVSKAAGLEADSAMAGAANRDNSTAAMLKSIESTRSGITVRITTGPSTRDVSTQTPSVTIQGTEGSMKGQLEGLPLIGESYSQTFSDKRIGDFLSVRLHVDPEHGDDGWHVSKIEVQSGYGNSFTTLQPITCEGVFHNNVWLNNAASNTGYNSSKVHLGGSSALAGSNDDVSSATATHASGANVAGAPEWTFIPEGKTAPKCSHFVPQEVSNTCGTVCGYKGGEHVGDVPCQDKSTSKINPDSDCIFWGAKKPAAFKKQCPSTPTCVEWKAEEPTKLCATNCGFVGDVKKGEVKCRETKSGQIVGDAKCTFWNLVKPSVPLKSCPAIQACVKWMTSKPTDACLTTCGAEAAEHDGKSFCQETVSGSTVADSKCTFSGTGSSELGPKPALPTKACPMTKRCVEWTTKVPENLCSSKCGFKGDTLTGTVQCSIASVLPATRVSDSECEFWSLKKPATPTKKCPTQKTCMRFGVMTPAAQNQTCSKKCGHPVATLTGAVTCCELSGTSTISNCIATTENDACHDSWSNSFHDQKPEAPTEICDAAAACVSFVENSAEPCPTACGIAAVSRRGTVTCHETKTQRLVTDAQCSAQNLTKPEVVVRKCNPTAACPTPAPTIAPTTLSPTDTPTGSPTSSPTMAPTLKTNWVMKLNIKANSKDGAACSENWGAEMAVKLDTFTVGSTNVNFVAKSLEHEHSNMCASFSCNSGEWCAGKGVGRNLVQPLGQGYMGTVPVVADASGWIAVAYQFTGFESDDTGYASWLTCTTIPGDECLETGVGTFKISTDSLKGSKIVATDPGNHRLEITWTLE